MVSFSVFGLALYSVLAPAFGLPVASYLSPELLAASVKEPSTIGPLFVALTGHFLASGLAGLLSGYAVRVLGRWTAFPSHSSAWDHFVHGCIPRHWIIVGLKNGDAYSGKLEMADTSVRLEERDLVIEEPALFDQESGDFTGTGNQYLFLPGDMIDSVAVVFDPALDKRLTPLSEDVYMEKSDVKDSSNPTSAPRTSPPGDQGGSATP